MEQVAQIVGYIAGNVLGQFTHWSGWMIFILAAAIGFLRGQWFGTVFLAFIYAASIVFMMNDRLQALWPAMNSQSQYTFQIILSIILSQLGFALGWLLRRIVFFKEQDG